MNQNIVALVKIVLVSGAVATVGVLSHQNNKLSSQNADARTQITNLKAQTQNAKKQHKETVQELPNTYQAIRQAGNDVIKIQNQLVTANQQTNSDQYNSLIQQLKGYLGSNLGWDAATPWIPDKGDKMSLIFGGTSDGGSSYKIAFKITDKDGNLLNIIQGVYSDNRFNNLTLFNTPEGDSSDYERVRQYRGFANKDEQYKAYKNAVKALHDQEIKQGRGEK